MREAGGVRMQDERGGIRRDEGGGRGKRDRRGTRRGREGMRTPPPPGRWPVLRRSLLKVFSSKGSIWIPIGVYV